MSIQKQEISPEMEVLCSECETGVLRLEYITYFTWLNEMLVTVPNFPAWICDHCGRRQYDPRAISWLNTLLHPSAGYRRPLRRPQAPRVGPPLP